METIDLSSGKIEVRRHPRARHISLRIDAQKGCAVLTLPRWASHKRGMAFALKHRDWIEKKLTALPQPIPLPEGVTVDMLRERARKVIIPLAEAKAAAIGKTIKSISLRDPRTRWGSCSPDGRLNFSWRLILAPRQVLDYVVAHEVAHLKYLNHGKRFWALCESIHKGDMEAARRWLRENGDRLMRYG